MNRRQFLGAAATAAALTGLREFSFGEQIRRIGLELYTVRRAMQKDFDGTLAKVAATGYREVEFAGYFGRSPQDVKRSLASVGLVSPSTHIEYGKLGEQWPSVLESAKIIGHQYVVCPSVDEKIRQQADVWQRTAEAFNRAGEAARAAGLQFAYHNHAFEFEPVNGKLPYDILLKETDPALVKMEMDIFWLVKGGGDPLAYFSRYPGRFPLVHVKGRDRTGNMSEVTADNSIDWKALFAHSKQAGIEHYFVEHDEAKDEFASIATSFRYLQQLRF